MSDLHFRKSLLESSFEANSEAQERPKFTVCAGHQFTTMNSSHQRHRRELVCHAGLGPANHMEQMLGLVGDSHETIDQDPRRYLRKVE
jgi:hypothetical protein